MTEIPTEGAEFRLFVVGCGRSGTTVVQRKLSAELSAFTLPETWFFASPLDSPTSRLLALNHLQAAVLGEVVSGSKAARGLQALLYWIPKLGMVRTARALFSTRRTAALFVDVLDGLSRSASRRGWIEKTPRHCVAMDTIRETVPRAKFVFMIRPGRDVVASIVDRARRYPDAFPGQEEPGQAIELWNASLQVALEQRGAPDTCFLDFESLVARPEESIDAVLAYHSLSRTARRPVSHDRIKLDEEPWKARSLEKITPPASKWERTFPSDHVRAEIESRLDQAALARVRAAPNYLPGVSENSPARQNDTG